MWLNTTTRGVQDYCQNPVLKPVHFGEWILGDPTVVIHNNQIHLWANEIFHGIIHFVAPVDNPFDFSELENSISSPGATRPFALKTKDSVILYFEQYTLSSLYYDSILMYTEAKLTGGWRWTQPKQVLSPFLKWEKIGTRRVGNPFVFYNKYKKKWWLYYSASSIHLNDSNIDEPLYIGLAEANSPKGPWSRTSKIVVRCSKNTIGLGSLKVFKQLSEYHLLGFCNRIVSERKTGSIISLIQSTDGGLTWTVKKDKLIAPTQTMRSWKKAYVYGYDFIEYSPGYSLIYYNARNGWKNGVETIGVSRVDNRLLSLSQQAAL
jgi:hypothetical protein